MDSSVAIVYPCAVTRDDTGKMIAILLISLLQRFCVCVCNSAINDHVESCCWHLFGLDEYAVLIYIMAHTPS